MNRVKSRGIDAVVDQKRFRDQTGAAVVVHLSTNQIILIVDLRVKKRNMVDKKHVAIGDPHYAAVNGVVLVPRAVVSQNLIARHGLPINPQGGRVPGTIENWHKHLVVQDYGIGVCGSRGTINSHNGIRSSPCAGLSSQIVCSGIQEIVTGMSGGNLLYQNGSRIQEFCPTVYVMDSAGFDVIQHSVLIPHVVLHHGVHLFGRLIGVLVVDQSGGHGHPQPIRHVISAGVD